LLLRVARGEQAERAPVWLLRQAGRYMKAFRSYSDRLPFRERSETADIAVALSLQPYEAFRPDGVIMFSDILTPLPALGIDFDVIKGRGPVIANPIGDAADVAALRPMTDPDVKLPFVSEILGTLRREVCDATTVIGFVGTPWTLAAYSIEGGADRHLRRTKRMMFKDPAILEALLDHMTDALIEYMSYQIASGAQIMQLFDSWAHHLSPAQFERFSLPYIERAIAELRRRHPDTPLAVYVNGCGGKLDVLQRTCTADVVGVDWGVTMQDARQAMGSDRTLQGNVDPMTLFSGDEAAITEAVHACLSAGASDGAGGGGRHILNVGHGVIQQTPEEAVAHFVKLAREAKPSQAPTAGAVKASVAA